MNLTINPNFQTALKPAQKKSDSRYDFSSKYYNGLSQDTVSFTGRNKTVQNLAANTLKEVFRNSYENKIPANMILSAKFMDTLEAVANKLRQYGVQFDREYCELHPVKDAESCLSKFIRSGATPSDQIRATLYLENLYDLSIVGDKILPELKSRGYAIQMIPDVVQGKKVKSKKPDFELRLDGLTEDDLTGLPPELRRLTHPQLSGYEDIQMRLIDTLSSGKNKPPHELLIIFGKNYASAKYNESYYVYDITRVLQKALHAAQVENPAMYSPAKRIADNIKILREQLNTFISKPLFINAKNLDFYHEEAQLPVEIGKPYCISMPGLVEGIRNKIPLYYKEELKKVNTKEYETELQRLVEESPEFKERTDKTVFVQDIRKMKNELIKQLKTNLQEDLELIQKVQDRLAETIKKYGQKS